MVGIPVTPIPVTIVGGYLGAGKTTLINHVLTGSHGLRIAVLVNDFGTINIDASLIADASDDTISLTNGCVCCSIHDDLGAALDLQTRRTSPPDHILIETSGVAEPARILTYATGWPGVRLDAVVTLVDVETIRARADDKFVGRVVRRQLAAADFLVVNKLDLVTDAERRSMAQWLGHQAPDAQQIEAVLGKVDPTLLFDPAGLEGSHVPHRRASGLPFDHGKAFSGVPFYSATIELPPVNIDALFAALQTLPTTIHRLKGLVSATATGERWIVQRVGNRQSFTPAPRAATPKGGSALVLIGTVDADLRLAALTLAPFATPGPPLP
jgi:G3E family GTPase